MLFLISIILVLLVSVLFSKQIKKYRNTLYILSAVIAVLIIVYSKLKLGQGLPMFVSKKLIPLLTKSIIPTAGFTVVMFTGALNKKWSITKKLYSIRAELSIISSILTLGHNISFGINIFPVLLTNPTSMPYARLYASIFSLAAIILMIPLCITSFPAVRKKMNHKSWKKLQRSAYVFYALIYAHIVSLIIPKMGRRMTDLIIYSVVFIGYYIMRVYRYAKDKK